ncbi:MAG TPA: glycosyl hydrolase family 28-related protein [Thermoanaerobaculia bacterium]
MTVTSAIARNDYTGSGSTGPYTYNFRIYAETDLYVTKQDAAGNVTVLSWPTDFTVTGVSARTGGTITLTTALATGEHLTIQRVRPLTQLLNIRNQGAMFPANIEDGLDQVVMLAQQQQDAIDRSFKVPSTIPPSTINPTIQDFIAGYYLQVRPDGLGLQGVTSVIASQNFQQSGVGSVIRTMNEKARETYTPYDFNAKGDGATDDTAALTALFNQLVAVGGGRASINVGTFRVASNLAIPAGVILDFTAGGVLQPANGVTITVNGPIVAPLKKVFANALAGQGTIALKNSDLVHVRWFGAKGDGATDDTAAIQAAINCAINSGLYCVVLLGSGTYKTTSTITYSTGQTPITLLGAPWGVIGPNASASTIKYTGAGGAILQDNGQFSNYAGFSLRNYGSADYGLKFVNGIRNIIFDVSFSQQAAGTSAFAVSGLDFSSEYSYIDRCEMEMAGVAIYLRAGAATTVDIQRCIFDPGSGAFTGIKSDAVSVKKLTIEKCTFNYRAANSVGIDLSALTGAEVVSVQDNEWDGNVGYVNAFLLKASNVNQLIFTRNAVDRFSVTGDAPILITSSRLAIWNNNFSSMATPIVRSTDTASLITAGPNYYQESNTGKLVDETGTTFSSNLIPVAISGGGVATLHGDLGDPNSEMVFVITPVTGGAFTVHVADPASSAPDYGFMTLGQKFTVLVKNASGGDIASGNVVFGTEFVLIGPKFECPPNGKYGSITFVWNGTVAVELRRYTAAPVPVKNGSTGVTIPGYQHFTMVDATAGMRTQTLPDPRNVGDGVRYTVKKSDVSANVVRVAGGAANIDGTANFDIAAQNEAATFVSRVSDVSYWIESRKT